jgi:hypothetical protein
MSYWKDYTYVDAQTEHPVTKVKLPWVRMRVGDVQRRIVAKASGSNAFATVQRFKDATSLLEMQRERDKAAEALAKKLKIDKKEAARQLAEEEADHLPDHQPHYHGLYFDFDADPEKQKGPAYGVSLEEAQAMSLADARALVDWFARSFPDINHTHIQAWYSGSKGFHVVVRPEPFGIKPHIHLSYIVKAIACELADTLSLRTLDRSVYSIPRMWRIPNTVHPKTGRYKIELAVKELTTWTPAQIIDKARGPRGQSDDALPDSHIHELGDYKDIPPDPVAVAWYADHYQAYDAYRDLKKLLPRKAIVRPDENDEYPVCVQDILKNGPKEGGPNRNRVVLPLAGFFHDAGVDKRDAVKQIDDWTRLHYPIDKNTNERISNGRSVVDSAYRGQVKFSCRFIRSLSGTGENGRVACVTEAKCPWIHHPTDQEPAQIPEIHLSEASKGCYVNTKVKTAVHVAAIAKSPFELPVKGRVNCNPSADAAICEKCPNNFDGAKGKLEFTLDAEDRHVLDMIDVGDSNRKGTIKAKAGIPKDCHKHWVEVLESSNVEELQVIPMVDYAHAYEVAMNDDDDLGKKSAKHVVRRAFYVGHGIEANKKYMIESTVFGHPKDQRICFLFDKADPAQNDIDQFHMTAELKEKLRLFQPRPGQTVSDKLLEIHRDLTSNVHQIGGRFDLSIAVDLCYHSVIGFKFAGQPIHKGWFELLVMGDTGTGKTTLIERLMRHYGLGELIAGEDSKRTGLVYASIQMQGQWILRWGKIPQNDRRLLIIDEFAGIPGEEVGKMTQLRSSGRAVGGGVNADYETWARTRLILITNPRNNRGQMAGFNYGVQAVEDLFDEAQDLRRVDLAIIAEKEEVKTELINKRWDKSDLPHVYTADLCRSLVLWAWSREPHQVEWMPGAEDCLLRWADRLGDTYECDIPLAERADLRLKLARISAAVAARLFSTDAEAKKVLITTDHVDFAATFMDRSYRKKSMAYFEYARKYKQDNHYSEEKKALIKRMMMSFGDESETIIATMLDVDLLSKPMFADMVNLDQDDLRKLWKFLVGERLLRKTTKGYRKTSAFTKFLKSLGGGKSGYSGELPDDFETGGNFDAHKGQPAPDAFFDEDAPPPEAPAYSGEDPPF